jgi:DNA adenine methylase
MLKPDKKRFRGGIQKGMVAKDEEATLIEDNLRFASEYLSRKYASRGLIRKKKLSPDEIPGGIGACEPDGGLWYYNGRLVAAFESKKQDVRGNAIERWFKNNYICVSINLNVNYVTFCSGDGSRKGEVVEKTLNVAHPKGFDVYNPNGNSCYLSENGFSQDRILRIMETVFNEILEGKFMKPIFTWAGGKGKLLKHYEPYMPEKIESYCEPFFGGGAMFGYVMNIYSPKNVWINDVNESVMNIYKSIRDDKDVFVSVVDGLQAKYIPMSKEDRKSFYFDVRHQHAYDYESWSKVKEAGVLYFLMKTGFNGIYQVNKNTNGRYGTPSGLLNQTHSVYDRQLIEHWSAILQNVNIMSGDWKDCATSADPKSFFFLDPPYRDSFADYSNSFNDDMLSDLLDFADTCETVMLSNRDDDNWFSKNKRSMNHIHIDVTYTAGRRKLTEDGYEAKSAREILLYRTGRAPQKKITDFFV